MNTSESKNLIAAHFDINGNIIAGDGITIINFKETTQYKVIQEQITELNNDFEKVRQELNENQNNTQLEL
ncbi:hypothetical protein [Dyadobacter sp. NIV53]|uniref:hypothetical protein n=1 Tax=Dyadobacter sp. NIV53 TaxID=2861765 RepID=UPI001C86C60E|nr:hypothetical protein [Dyadobacter sp. NIV53]